MANYLRSRKNRYPQILLPEEEVNRKEIDFYERLQKAEEKLAQRTLTVRIKKARGRKAWG